MSDDKKGLTPREREALQRLDELDGARFEKFAQEFHAESDRAAVILGAAKLDELLRELLEKCFLPKVGDYDELLGDEGGERPLSALSARINAAYRLGLISADFTRSLHRVRKIRNRFAHRVPTRR
jgi:hypothetical protein